ncbi:MAG: hypothetical protein NT085_05455 [candidate division SR1 bacterium]|nr:hypothetical protein [candidate division SR1 bacterium]
MNLLMFEQEDYFHGSQKRTPKYKNETPTGTTKKGYDVEAIAKFFGKDVLGLLGQGPIKKDPVRKTKETVEEPLSEEDIKAMKELWGDDYMSFKM